ncbi:hypothetical protein [Aquabacterium sp.]|uniref:hypothetical protein n=1 Tax=Aquabacterium sp. TaxID=1872578 RepID=UPI0025BC8976|nr:hypothetical protein [Aquabacterium sp.]
MSKDSSSFLRKVVRFVANPTTDWSELDAPNSDAGESEYAKTEIKAMIERKRRNDFVRKRELDMLRKIRREGLTPDQALLLGSASNLDPDSRPQSGARSDSTVKAKIDEIELQMVGQGMRPAAQPSQTGQLSTLPGPLSDLPPTAPATLALAPTLDDVPEVSQAVVQAARSSAPRMPGQDAQPSPSPASGVQAGVQVVEMAHDPELDEAVIAFANADFDQCEACLMALVHPGASRHHHMETWLVLFDLFRALDMPHKFDQLAISFAQQFGVSAPQWYSLPRRVAEFLERKGSAAAPTAASPDAGADANGVDPDHGPATEPGEAPPALPGWVAPTVLDQDAVAQLRVAILQLPRPWRMDFSALQLITPEGAHHFSGLLQAWAREPMALTWAGAARLLALLEESTPAGNRDADPAFWMLRLDVLRLVNQPVAFDEVAIDYCVTYERSPPSWEPSACLIKQQDGAVSAHAGPLSHISEVTTSFVESQVHQEVEFVQIANLDLSGQLVGDIGRILQHLDDQLGASISLDIDCRHLLRVDFIAAGDLLNWVLARRAEERQVQFINPHRLVALFFGAMGINEHATVKLQTV